MRPISRLICLALMLGMFSPTGAADKKTIKKDDKSDKQETKDKMVSLGSLLCRISRIEGAQKNITVQISQPTLQFAGRGFRIAMVTRDLELQPSDDMKVRMLRPPLDFDEKGRPRKYTAKELKEMKGPDPKLPGYSADFDSLKPDQVVKVYLSMNKDARKALARSRSKRKDKDKDPEDAPATSDKPEITMVVIIAEPKK